MFARCSRSPARPWLQRWSLLALGLFALVPSGWSACVSPRLFIGVDQLSGNDGNCDTVDLGGSALNLFVACQTIGQAITLAQAQQLQTWIHIIGGSYAEGGLQIAGIPGGGGVHLGSNLPSCMTNTQLNSLGDGSWKSRTVAGLAIGVQMDCVGFGHCFSVAHSTLEINGIQFINSQQHVVQAIDTEEDDARDAAAGGAGAPSRVIISNSAFIGTGGVVAADGCRVQITGCLITQSLLTQSSPVQALVQLNQSALVLTDSNFVDNQLPSSPTLLRSCVSLYSVGSVQREVVIDRCMWRNNFASSSYSDPRLTSAIFGSTDREPYPLRIPGGVAVRLITDNLRANISHSAFINCSIACPSCMGGAVAVSTLGGAPGYRVDFAIHSSTFTDCSNNGQDGQKHKITCCSRRVGGAVSVAESDSWWAPLAVLGLSSIFADTMAEVLLSNSVFQSCSAGFGGGAVHIGAVKSFQFTTSVLRGCSCLSDSGGALRIKQEKGTVHSFNTQPVSFFLIQLTFEGNTAGTSGGSIHLEQLTSNLVIDSAAFDNSTATRGLGGAINANYCIQIAVLQCQFNHTTAITGGAAAISRSRFAILDQCTFAKSSAAQSGGGVWMDSTPSTIQGSSFEDCSLSFVDAPADSNLVVQRMGGAIFASGSDLSVLRCSFTRSSALPNQLLPQFSSPSLNACADFYDAATALCRVGLGGVIAALLSALQLESVTIIDAQACSGAIIYALSSSAIRMTSCETVRNLASYSGGLVAASATQSVTLTAVHVQSSAAVQAGGVVVSANSPQLTIQQCTIDDSQCSSGDGGVIWYTHNRPALLTISHNTFSNYRAPEGAGGVLFLMIQLPHEFVLPASAWIDRPEWDNHFDRIEPASPDLVKYGTLHATSVLTLSPSLPLLVLYPGLDHGPNSTQASLTVLASDAYGQPITAERQLVVGVSDARLPSSPGVLTFNGVTLKSVNASSGLAPFQGLIIGGQVGAYEIQCALPSQPTIAASLNLTIPAGCPPSFYLSESGMSGRICIQCASASFVYDSSSNTCRLCPRGTQRYELTPAEQAALNSAGVALPGPLHDGVECRACPLGSLSETDGSSCQVCPAASYRPTPASECVSCTSIAGLQCANGVPTISGGYFALSVTDEQGRAQVQSYQCPDSFCSEAVIQNATTSAGSNGNSTSAVTAFDQCAYPRLASPTNLLCGECAADLRVWGNECTRCDGVNQVSVVLLLLLSIFLVLLMLRSAMRSSSASHLVVVSYFVQTVMLELGTFNPLLSWLNIALFSPNSFGSCVAPPSPYEQTQIAIVMPLVLLAELACVGMLHFLVCLLMCCRPPPAPHPSSTLSPSSSLYAQLRVFNINFYISAALSMLLFFYSQVTIACMRYIYCVDVAGVSVVFSQPVMRCASSEYRRTLILVIFGLVVYVGGFPLAIAFFLRRRAGLIRKLIAYSATQGGGNHSMLDFQAINLSPPASQFLQRYSPLFAMYSVHAWAWQLVVLARRATFVILAVTLVHESQLRFMAFSIAHVASMCAQLYAEPFRVRFLNVAELSSVVLLMLHTMILTAAPPPYHRRAIDVLIFLMVVPPLMLYPIIAIAIQRRETRAERRRRQRQIKEGATADTIKSKQAAQDDDWTSNPEEHHGTESAGSSTPTFAAIHYAAAAEGAEIEMTTTSHRKDARIGNSNGKGRRSLRTQSSSVGTTRGLAAGAASGSVRLRTVDPTTGDDADRADALADAAEVHIRLHPAVITEDDDSGRSELGPASPSASSARDQRARPSSAAAPPSPKHNKARTPSAADDMDAEYLAHARRIRSLERSETDNTEADSSAPHGIATLPLQSSAASRDALLQAAAPSPAAATVSAPAPAPAPAVVATVVPVLVPAPASVPAASSLSPSPSPRSLPPSTPLHLRRGVPVRPSPAITAGPSSHQPAGAAGRLTLHMGQRPQEAVPQRLQLRGGVPVRPNTGTMGNRQLQPQQHSQPQQQPRSQY